MNEATSPYQQLRAQLAYLRLEAMAEALPELLEAAPAGEPQPHRPPDPAAGQRGRGDRAASPRRPHALRLSACTLRPISPPAVIAPP